MLVEIKQDLKQLADPEKAKILRRFFKTGKGEYGEGDEFIGIKVPIQRQVAGRYRDMPLNEVQKLLNSRIHEYRLTALFILVDQYQRQRKKHNLGEMTGLVNFYLANLKKVNNWDLVDLSAPKILGDYLCLVKNIKLQAPNIKKIDVDLLYNLAKSKNLWKRRTAILSTYTFIKEIDFEPAEKISRMLLRDKHDLIHKAVGWMLREIGKQDEKTLLKFLDKYHARMPRTMLRYAVEKLDEGKKSKYIIRKLKTQSSKFKVTT